MGATREEVAIPVIATTREESSCCYRMMLRNLREATFITHHPDTDGPIAIKLAKEQNACFLCNCTPHKAEVMDADGYRIGKVELPWWRCCFLPSPSCVAKARDSKGKDRYVIHGSACQNHTCLPCCYDF